MVAHGILFYSARCSPSVHQQLRCALRERSTACINMSMARSRHRQEPIAAEHPTMPATRNCSSGFTRPLSIQSCSCIRSSLALSAPASWSSTIKSRKLVDACLVSLLLKCLVQYENYCSISTTWSTVIDLRLLHKPGDLHNRSSSHLLPEPSDHYCISIYN